MRNEVKRDSRKKWVRPALQRMDAGSAENGPNGSPDDGHPSGNKMS